MLITTKKGVIGVNDWGPLFQEASAERKAAIQENKDATKKAENEKRNKSLENEAFRQKLFPIIVKNNLGLLLNAYRKGRPYAYVSVYLYLKDEVCKDDVTRLLQQLGVDERGLEMLQDQAKIDLLNGDGERLASMINAELASSPIRVRYHYDRGLDGNVPTSQFLILAK